MTPDASGIIRTVPKKEKISQGASLKAVLVPGDPEDDATLQRIFRESRVLGRQRLAAELNKDGLPSPTGKRWRKSGLRGILINRKGKNQKREYLLSAGFGKCGRCGGVVNGVAKRVKSHPYARYYCSTSHNVGPSACAGYGIPMDSLESEALKRKPRQAKPALDKDKVKGLVARGLAFYQERVPGSMATLAPKKTTVVEGAVEDGASEERGDATPKGPEERPCVPELREMLRLPGVKFTYDPDGKEGTLEFDPFG